MDLTAGITQMQSQLKPDMFAGYQAGANAYATAEKQGQEIASNRIKNENSKREQELQTRLQKVIEESFDPATGQPDYNKMAILGHQYGITAQQMDYSIKHLKDNWEAIAATAQNKQQVDSVAVPGWNTQTPSTQTTNPPTPPAKVTTEVTPPPPAKVEPAKIQDTTTKGTAPVVSTKEADQTGSSTGASTQLKEDGGVTITAPEPPKVNAEEGKMAPLASDLDPFKYTAPEPPKNTLYTNVNKMEVNNPFSMGGLGDGFGGGDGSGLIQPPYNRKGVDTTINPQEDIEGNTKAWLRNHSYNSGDYGTDYNQALNDVSASVMAKMPLVPIRTGDYKKDMEALNTYRNEVQKVRGEALQAKLKLRDEIASGNYTAADNTLKTLANTIEVDYITYRGRDAAARATALSLIPVKSEIPQFDEDLNKVKDNDIAGLGMMLARGARLYAGALSPGSQVSEGSLAEVGRQVFGDDDISIKKLIIGGMAAWNAKGMDGLAEFANGLVDQHNGASIKSRLHEMAQGASTAIDSTLKASLVGYKGSSSGLKKPEGSPEPTKVDSETPIVKTGWYNRKPGDKIFKAESGDNYVVTGRDPMGYPNQAKDKEGNVVKIVGDQDGPSKGVSIVPWNQESPTKKGAKAPAKKSETPAERHKRLFGN